MIDGRAITKWLTPGIGVKRWLLLLIFGILLVAFAIAYLLFELRGLRLIEAVIVQSNWFVATFAFIGGLALIVVALLRLSNNILAPYRNYQQRNVVDAVYSHSKRHKGLKLVAIGGGTGLPSVIRGMKPITSNITVVVTVADDGGSSGRLRREQGVLPPGDLRQNIAALADDESLITQLFQYRFENGDLGGHSFGNLFITAMAGVTGSLEQALIETERVLNIQGRVLPSTLEDIRLVADIIPPGKTRPLTIRGESKITEVGGKIERLAIEPAEAVAYAESVRAIREADIVVIGPGSLYTSILPNLLVRDIKESLRATNAYKIYVCNVAIQPGETDGYTVADHVMALEQHIGRGVFQAVIANNAYPTLNAGDNTIYVPPAPEHHEITQRYEVYYTDLTDPERPWRHDPPKLARGIISLSEAARVKINRAEPIPV